MKKRLAGTAMLVAFSAAVAVLAGCSGGGAGRDAEYRPAPAPGAGVVAGEVVVTAPGPAGVMPEVVVTAARNRLAGLSPYGAWSRGALGDNPRVN